MTQILLNFTIIKIYININIQCNNNCCSSIKPTRPMIVVYPLVMRSNIELITRRFILQILDTTSMRNRKITIQPRLPRTQTQWTLSINSSTSTNINWAPTQTRIHAQVPLASSLRTLTKPPLLINSCLEALRSIWRRLYRRSFNKDRLITLGKPSSRCNWLRRKRR
jgi:hypothetical protein